ncbi:MAG: LamG domain-containing protein [Pirellulaceae bacterium]
MWQFDADVSPQPDASGHGHVGEPGGDVAWVNDPERGGVMEFDGDADYLEVEDTDLLSIEGDITIAAWVNINSFASWNSIISKTGDVETNKPAPFDLYTMHQDNGVLRAYIGDGAGSLSFGDSFDPPELETWQHIAVTINEDGDFFHYLNGEENGEGFIVADRIDNDTNVFIGSRADFVTNMFGRMDDVALFNEVLDMDQINTIMAGDFSAWGVNGGGGGGTPGDFNADDLVNAQDIDLLTAASIAGNFNAAMDLNEDGSVNNLDRDVWVNEIKNTWFGDSNLDGEFNSADFVTVFTAGEYEDSVAMNSTWGTGDWNGDGEFSSSDFVAAFTAGGYEMGPKPAVNAVPEPGISMILLSALGLLVAPRLTGRIRA